MVGSDFLIVGLGNPGESYSNTRHNIGFIIVDELARRWGCSLTTEKWQACFGKTSLGRSRVCLLKPNTYMNLSGRAVDQFVGFFRVSPDNILVVHDDIDMPPGRLKFVRSGGAGGHNGIRSIIQSLGTKEFLRLKIGVGRPGTGEIHPGIPVDKYVLAKIPDNEMTLLFDRMDVIEQGVRLLLEGHPDKAMNLANALK